MSLCIGTKKELICVFETFFYYKNARILAVFFTVPLMSHFYFLYHIQRFYVQHFFITYNAFSIYIYIYSESETISLSKKTVGMLAKDIILLGSMV